MSNFNNLIIYINSKIKELKAQYNLDELKVLENELLKNIKLFEVDIEKINLELVKKIFNENYSEDLALKNYELLLEIKEFGEDLYNHTDEPQIQVCLKFINKFQNLFQKKLLEVKSKLSEIEQEQEVELKKYFQVLTYFDNNNLIKILSNKELEELFDILSNLDINKEELYDLITEITVRNIDLYEKKKVTEIQKRFEQVERNSDKINKLINDVIKQNGDVKTEETVLEEPELVQDILDILEDKENSNDIGDRLPEEEKIYNNILEIYETLKLENINISLVDELLALIKLDDFSLEETRKDLYNPSISMGNIWAVILLDLEKNLLPNFNEHKKEIIEVFKYIIELYNKNYISQRDFILQLPVIEEADEIESIISEYNLLPDVLKNNILSMKSIVNEYGIEVTKSYDLNISNEKLEYYLCMERIKELFFSYNDKIKEEIENDKNLADILISEINDIKQEILELLEKLNELREEINKEENEMLIEDSLVSSSYENLLVFLPKSNNEMNIHDTLIENIETLKKNYRDDYKEFVSQSILAIDERLLKTPFSQIRNLSQVGGKRGKTKNKNGILENDKNKPKLDEYDVFRYKPKIGTGARICYMILKMNDNNKERLKKYFNMDSIGDICLILNLDASVKDEKEYVKRAHDILLTRESDIQKLIQLFSNDFTEESFDIATSLIEKSMGECLDLKENFCKKEEKNIGGNDD